MGKKEKKVKTTQNVTSSVSVKDSVRTKLITIMALLVAVPLVIAIIVSYNTSTNKAKSDALDLLNSNAKLLESEFANVIEKNVVGLQSFAAAPSTITYLNTYGAEEVTIPDSAMQAEMQVLDNSIGDGNQTVLANANGQQLVRSGDGALSDISEREFFQDCKASLQPTTSDILISQANGTRIMVVIVPVVDDQTGAFLGTVQRSFDLNNFHELLAEHVSDGYIADRTGIVAAHATHEITPEDEPEDHSTAEFMTSSETSGMYESTATGKLAYISWVKEPISGWTIAVAEQDSVVMAEAVRSAMITVIIGIVLLVIGVMISIIIANSFVKPILAVNSSLSELADGGFSRISGYSKRKDEFGEIVRNFNDVIKKLQDIVTSIKNSANTVTVSSEDLADMANQISATTEGVSNAVQEIATGAVQQAEEIQEAAENVGKITDAVTGVQNSTGNMESLASKMKEASETSSASLLNLQKSSSDMTSKIEEIARTISATQDAVANINERVDGISDIASQTNLLSLNASIEAARAGEAGKGFAVVAEEIRKLADDSDSMAQEIRKEMDELLREAEAAVAAADLVKEGNLEQQEAIGETLESVNGMLQDIDGTVLGVRDISGGANTCVTSNEVVSDAMSSLSAISEENAASSETTGASVQELSATVSSLANSAGNLKEIAEKLNEEMSFFK